MKTMLATLCAILVGCLVGCATLQQRGAIEPADVAAACKDVSVACAALMASGHANADATKYCAAAQVACVAAQQ